MTSQSRAKKLLAALGGVVLAFGMSSASYAGLMLVDFKPDPTTPGFPELQYTTSGSPAVVQLTENLNPATAGATGNHDIATAGGLRAEATIPGLDLSPGDSRYNVGYVPNNGAGTTVFLDTSLHLAGLTPKGFAQPAPYWFQPLNNGTFQLKSYSPTVSDPEYMLLEGQINNAFIVAQGSTGSVLSGDVTYTGGKIYDALRTQLGLPANTAIPGDLSWSLSTQTPSSFTFSGSPGSYVLNDFVANMTGQFNYVPEPGMLSSLALGAVALIGRRRRR